MVQLLRVTLVSRLELIVVTTPGAAVVELTEAVLDATGDTCGDGFHGIEFLKLSDIYNDTVEIIKMIKYVLGKV